MKYFRFSFVFYVCLIFLSGCLKTRTEVKEVEQRQNLAQTVTTLQRDTADVNSRFSDVNDELRNIRGRIEVVENKLQTEAGQTDRDIKVVGDHNSENSKKIALLQDTIIKMDAQIQNLSAEVLAQKAEIAAARAMVSGAGSSAGGRGETTLGSRKDPFATASALFETKDWKKAILGFQEYREKNPNGKKLPEATYKMGVCFQELGLKDEAKTFFDEVIAKHSQSPEAKKAKLRLKSIKK